MVGTVGNKTASKIADSQGPNLSRVFPRPLIPLYFYRHERELIEQAIDAIRADTDPEPFAFDGQCLEWLCADWLARLGP